MLACVCGGTLELGWLIYIGYGAVCTGIAFLARKFKKCKCDCHTTQSHKECN